MSWITVTNENVDQLQHMSKWFMISIGEMEKPVTYDEIKQYFEKLAITSSIDVYPLVIPQKC